MEDLVELGFEAFDKGIDRYHDNIYDGVTKVGPRVTTWSQRYRSKSKPPELVKVQSTTPGKDQMQDAQEKTARRKSGGAADEYYDLGNDLGSKGRRSRRNSRTSRNSGAMYDEKSRVEEWARRSQTASPPQIRVEDEGSHLYPPPPQSMAPPYPTAGQLVPMPPDAPYPMQRSTSYEQERGRYESIPRNNDLAERGQITRSRSANYGRPRSPSRSRSRNRERSLDRGHRRRSGRDHYDEDNRHHSSRHFNHVTAGIAGAIAGGLLGRNVSKGDTVATVAGALVGALGAGVAEREWERHQSRKSHEEERWEKMQGRRY